MSFWGQSGEDLTAMGLVKAEGTPQTERFSELRNRAAARMLGIDKAPAGNTVFGNIIKYLFG